MAEIFISYARADRDYAKRLASYLEDARLSVWWDTSIKPGEEIERRIGEAGHMIVLWSETSVKSPPEAIGQSRYNPSGGSLRQCCNPCVVKPQLFPLSLVFSLKLFECVLFL